MCLGAQWTHAPLRAAPVASVVQACSGSARGQGRPLGNANHYTRNKCGVYGVQASIPSRCSWHGACGGAPSRFSTRGPHRICQLHPCPERCSTSANEMPNAELLCVGSEISCASLHFRASSPPASALSALSAAVLERLAQVYRANGLNVNQLLPWVESVQMGSARWAMLTQLQHLRVTALAPTATPGRPPRSRWNHGRIDGSCSSYCQQQV